MEKPLPEFITIGDRRFARPEHPSPQCAQQHIVEAFSLFDDWESRYQYVIDLGRALAPMDNDLKTDQFKVSGCQSQVWFYQAMHDGKLFFQAASDSILVSGLIAMLLQVYSGRDPHEIVTTQPDFVEQVGLARFLSPTRRNGLLAMLNNLNRCAQEVLAENA